jgi:hypothetical protein
VVLSDVKFHNMQHYKSIGYNYIYDEVSMGRYFLTIVGFFFLAITLLLALDHRRRLVLVQGPLQLNKVQTPVEDRLFLNLLDSYKDTVDSRLNK